MFSLVLILCLIATFSVKTTPVHKVIALLFLSVVTVLFWVSSTHFLFVYIVYIMAFIGAVLMLFLSVVLMLPISTTSQFSWIILALSSESVKELLPPVTLRPEGVIFPEEKVSFFYWVFLFYICFVVITKLIRVRSVFPLSKSLLETYNEAIVDHAVWACTELISKSKAYLLSYEYEDSFCLSEVYSPSQFFYPILPLIQKIDGKYKLNWKFHCEGAFALTLAFSSLPSDSPLLEKLGVLPTQNYWYDSYGCNLNSYFSEVFFTPEHPTMQKFARFISLQDVSKLSGVCRLLNFFLYYRLRSLFIFYAATHSHEMKVFFGPLTALLREEIPLLRSFLRDLLDKVVKFLGLAVKKAFYFFFTKAFLEILLQITVVTGFLCALIPSVYFYLQEKKDVLHATETINEVSGGLANIKELLYEHYNLLLILSTLVLLVALLGAAVMARKKR